MNVNANCNVSANYLVNTLLPFAADEMKRAEQMFVAGSDKLDAVMSHTREVYESTSGPEAFGFSFDDLKTSLQAKVESLVTIFNSEGIFVKKPHLKLA